MKARIVDEQVKAYSSMDSDLVSIATLTKGMEVEFGGFKRKDGKMWVPVTLDSGQKAFIPGDARLYAVREGALMQPSVDVHAEPSAGSVVTQQLKSNTHMYILEVDKESPEQWVHVRDMNGNEGYIVGDTRLRVFQPKTKALGRKNMLTGAMWLVAGGAVIYSSMKGTIGGSFTVLGYGALLFGGIMLIWGIVQFLTAPL